MGTMSESSLARDRWVRIICDYSAEGLWAKGGGGCGIDDLLVSPRFGWACCARHGSGGSGTAPEWRRSD